MANAAINHGEAAAELFDMRRAKRVEPDLPADLRPGDLADAYAIQAELVDLLLADGGGPAANRAIGYKCACTSEIAQEALQIDRPVFGRLLSATTTSSGSELDTDRFTHRVVEAEVGIRIGRDVPGRDGGHDIESISEYVDAVIPSIEIVDYRYADWSVGALRVAADNAIHGWWVHGEPATDWHHLDLAALAVSVRTNGEVTTTGVGANALGHPLTVVAWLADELPRFGRQLQAGDLITTGVVTDVFEGERGDAITADFDGLGAVSLSFG